MRRPASSRESRYCERKGYFYRPAEAITPLAIKQLWPCLSGVPDCLVSSWRRVDGRSKRLWKHPHVRFGLTAVHQITDSLGTVVLLAEQFSISLAPYPASLVYTADHSLILLETISPWIVSLFETARHWQCF